MIRFKCPCGRQLQAAESNAGQPARCPLCEQVTIVPFSDDAPPPPRGNVNEYGEIDRPEPKPDEPPSYSREDDRPRPRHDDRGRDRYDDGRRYDDDDRGPRRRPAYDEDYDDRPYRRRGGYYGPQQVCNDANTALWMSIVGILCCTLLCPISIIFGIKALNQINNSDGQLSGKGQAVAGIVIGTIGTLLIFFWVMVNLAGGM